MKQLLKITLVLFSAGVFAQAGHIMQGVGAVNMSMGGASTAQPLDISGALQWNPATISTFDSKIIDFSIGAFFSAPELSSSFGPMSGVTKDDRGVSPMPALAMVWGKENSKHTFGASAFGISGFGVTFPENMNYPQDMMGNSNTNFNPAAAVNPISFPQNAGGFGHIESDYMLLQIGLAWSYQITDNFSIGLQPTVNYASLELAPNPLSSPSMTLGYPVSDKATAIGFGGQIGVFYESDGGIKLGASYKTAQKFSDFEFSNTYLDNSAAPDVDFNMDYPAILSFGVGYSTDKFDLAVDLRRVDYENTEGFEAKGWTQTGSVNGFGWNDITILSVGLQYKGIKKLPLRVGYTHSSNPISEELAFFSIPATAIIKNAYQFGVGYEFSDTITINGTFHHGSSDGKTEGNLLSPMMASATNPYGAIPGTNVGYEMTTDMVMLGISYTFTK
ncbi:long-chain fatty acid transport protein [Lutibacter oricola]|uniref:Long-chain fatty acid transport protein n=1 Tax=Lutibacter oricola TaxID=762486 RepID=A0A1H2X8E6_9FLAO|nr:outer membrane protein transport protein [Lutibacter oricola]SDW88539.1 long-chain fatty acid transport protein [Lutibacter oricola]